MVENAEKKGDTVLLPVSGKGVRPTVTVTQKVVRFGGCPCYERRDVVVGIKNTGELPVRWVDTPAFCQNYVNDGAESSIALEVYTLTCIATAGKQKHPLFPASSSTFGRVFWRGRRAEHTL